MTITSDSNAIYKIRPYLPKSISLALARLDKQTLDRICEIRLRALGISSITIDNINCILSNSGISKSGTDAIITTSEEIEDFIYKFCKGSVYTHEESLSEFYLTSNGVRVGISGDAVYKNGNIRNVGKIKGINIRIPRHIADFSAPLMSSIAKEGFPNGQGILIISSPGVGKTTLLRDLAVKLSSTQQSFMDFSPKRVCVIDERHEIYMENIFSQCHIDFLSGIDKTSGIEIACRVLSPEIIICDEIATPTEAEKITRLKNSGVVFIASMHSDSFEDILKKDYVRTMFENGVFGACYCLSRQGKDVEGKLIKYTNA